MLKEKSGADLTQVPFGGGGESSAALLGGHIEAVVIPPSVIWGHVQAGKLRLLALFERERVATIAEVPTFKELGYDIVVSESVVLFGPKELPEDIVQILATAFNAAIKTESFKKFAADNQLIIDWQDGARIYQILSDEYQFLGDLAIRIKARS
jgi:tripartite-type tricarboxylate transporter receptor subunit TctC